MAGGSEAEKENSEVSSNECTTTGVKTAMREVFGPNFNSSQKYVISVQGPSTCGKTTLCRIMKTALEEKYPGECKVALISIDSFYENLADNNLKSLRNYDFDNPAAIEWDALVRTLKALINDSETYPESTYEFATMIRNEKDVPNPGFNIIIIEGIYGHNVFNDEIFNISEYSPYSSSKEIDVPYVKNTLDIGSERFHLFKILMSLDDDKILENRMRVDRQRTTRDEEEIIYRCKRFVFPATEKWVNRMDISKPNVTLKNGTWNFESFCTFLNDFLSYFKAEITEEQLNKYFTAFGLPRSVE